LLFTNLVIAQIHVNSTGSVGIGTTLPDDNTKLHITSDGLTSTSHEILNIIYTGPAANYHHRGIYSLSQPNPGYGYGGVLRGGNIGVYGLSDIAGSGNRYGVRGYAANGTTTNYAVYADALGNSNNYNYGVYERASGTANTNYGVYAYGTGNSYANYGIYAIASGSYVNNYAGYFSGNVTITGTLTNPSDEKLKQNIKKMDNSLEKISMLSAKTYNYKEDKSINLPKGKKYGFVAQELELVFPELVTEVVQPINEEPKHIDPENDDTNVVEREPTFMTYKAINYIELIPILTQAIQEQQTMIADLQKRIEKLEKK